MTYRVENSDLVGGHKIVNTSQSCKLLAFLITVHILILIKKTDKHLTFRCVSDSSSRKP